MAQVIDVSVFGGGVGGCAIVFITMHWPIPFWTHTHTSIVRGVHSPVSIVSDLRGDYRGWSGGHRARWW